MYRRHLRVLEDVLVPGQSTGGVLDSDGRIDELERCTKRILLSRSLVHSLFMFCPGYSSGRVSPREDASLDFIPV